mmetsp:Transcript_19424/g.44658  ORF Transcript_19424/g.44658 Transcript_19424/m.44658 type:complete len:329 (+) Transcript_19424:2790-3776(+)
MFWFLCRFCSTGSYWIVYRNCSLFCRTCARRHSPFCSNTSTFEFSTYKFDSKSAGKPFAYLIWWTPACAASSSSSAGAGLASVRIRFADFSPALLELSLLPPLESPMNLAAFSSSTWLGGRLFLLRFFSPSRRGGQSRVFWPRSRKRTRVNLGSNMAGDGADIPSGRRVGIASPGCTFSRPRCLALRRWPGCCCCCVFQLDTCPYDELGPKLEDAAMPPGFQPPLNDPDKGSLIEGEKDGMDDGGISGLNEPAMPKPPPTMSLTRGEAPLMDDSPPEDRMEDGAADELAPAPGGPAGCVPLWAARDALMRSRSLWHVWHCLFWHDRTC